MFSAAPSTTRHAAPLVHTVAPILHFILGLGIAEHLLHPQPTLGFALNVRVGPIRLQRGVGRNLAPIQRYKMHLDQPRLLAELQHLCE